jgi:hypothetical protein
VLLLLLLLPPPPPPPLQPMELLRVSATTYKPIAPGAPRDQRVTDLLNLQKPRLNRVRQRIAVGR